MQVSRRFTFCFLALIALAGMSGQAFATNYTVGYCAGLGMHYTTIQAAVNAAEAATAAGPRVISVCPGNYPEQVSISTANPHITAFTLQGVANSGAAVILPPSGGVVANTTDDCPVTLAYCASGAPIAAQLLVNNPGYPVTISDLTVDGTGNQDSGSPDLDGILFQNASGTINHVAVRNQLFGDVLTGYQSGQGIYVESSTGVSTVTVENSSVHGFTKNGITGRYAGTNLTATGNFVQGAGQTPAIAQNGIEIAFGATGSVMNNTVIDVVYGNPASADSTGILLFDAEEATNANPIQVKGNQVGNTQVGVGIYTDSPGVYGDYVNVSSNKIYGTGSYDGIDVCTDNNTISGNTLTNSAESGVHLDAGCGGGNTNTVISNTFTESACAGVLQDPGELLGSSSVSGVYYGVPFPLTSSTAGCTIPAFGGAVVRGRAPHRLVPAP
jgi:hypothetical protein